MSAIFQLVYSVLMLISEVTGLSYNEVNIIVYYIVLPFLYIALADKIWGKHILKIAYIASVALFLIIIPDFSAFSDWLFDKSVAFLLSLEIFGWDYIVSSVLVCVVFPGLVFALMLFFAYPQFWQFIRCFFSDDPDLEQGRHS